MSTWHGYILIDNIPPGWTVEQREIVWGALRGIGNQTGWQPAEITHTRQRLDGKALIVESLFEEAAIEKRAVAMAMGDALGLPWQAINARIDYVIFAEGGTWDESNAEARAYLKAHLDEWEVSEDDDGSTTKEEHNVLV